jgi:hypothetical protein
VRGAADKRNLLAGGLKNITRPPFISRPTPSRHACSAPLLVAERHVAGIASLLPPAAGAPPPLRRAASEALAELSVLPDFPPMQAEAALAPLVGCVEDADADVAAGALRALHNAVMDADSRLGRWGQPVRARVGWEREVGRVGEIVHG